MVGIGFPRGVDVRMVIAVVGVMLTALGLYLTLPEDKPNVSLVMINDTNVLDVHEPVEDLKILFQGKDIQEGNLNLRILTVKMVNSGETNILQSHYDVNDTWGIKVNGGEIIEARLLESNSDYIISRLNPRIVEGLNLIELEKVIFERNKYFVLEVLVLHEKGEMPTVMPLGKIAGVEEIEVVEREKESEETNFFIQVFSGSAWVQVARTFSYVLIAVSVIAGSVLIAFGITMLNRKRVYSLRRNEFKKLIEVFSDDERSRLARQIEVLSGIYKIGGAGSLATTKAIIGSEESIKSTREWQIYLRMKKAKGPRASDRIRRQYETGREMRRYISPEGREIAEISDRLIENDVVSVGEGDKPIIDGGFRELLDKLIM